MSHTIKIKDEVFPLLEDQATDAGVSPDVWVELKIRESASVGRKGLDERKKREALASFIGALDSSQNTRRNNAQKQAPLSGRVKNVFGEVVEQKMKRIGLKLPK
jgi:hypothetical protein